MIAALLKEIRAEAHESSGILKPGTTPDVPGRTKT